MGAYHAAVEYFQQAVNLIAADVWALDHATALALHMDWAEALYLLQQERPAESMFAAIESHLQTPEVALPSRTLLPSYPVHAYMLQTLQTLGTLRFHCFFCTALLYLCLPCLCVKSLSSMSVSVCTCMYLLWLFHTNDWVEAS